MGPSTATTSRESSPAPTTISEDNQPPSFRRSAAPSPSSQGTTRENTPAFEGRGQAQGQAQDLESVAEEENGDGGEEEGEPAEDLLDDMIEVAERGEGGDGDDGNRQ
jgi:hypothetical protein